MCFRLTMRALLLLTSLHFTSWLMVFFFFCFGSSGDCDEGRCGHLGVYIYI